MRAVHWRIFTVAGVQVHLPPAAVGDAAAVLPAVAGDAVAPRLRPAAGVGTMPTIPAGDAARAVPAVAGAVTIGDAAALLPAIAGDAAVLPLPAAAP